MGHLFRRKSLIFFVNYQRNFTVSNPMGPVHSFRSSYRSKFHSLFKVDR